ncbi:NUDIX hydrolase [Neolewinella agarilytica]|uniref:NUDIX domain-containing protein n=1 Tax=Neolewinella agarilytica TaxID=478744 RepID=A0A1H9LGL5_9BACT|nr:CoA pyrophosphatase [Neolewinella agarilytica]SER10544.1 NUDIX domain-containing protein [Neolewinella agarilytica]
MALAQSETQLLEQLRQRLTDHPLPGSSAQNSMSPPLRGTPLTPPATARRASVLALLYPIDGLLHLLFIQRTSPPGDRHAGQISFPGGSAEAADADAAATALRETEEEVGIPRQSIELLGALTPLYIPVSNFLVDPFVGYRAERPDFILQESEVARVLEIPLADFLGPEARKVGDRKLSSGMTLKEVPFWSVGDGEEIWGATSMMVGELVALLRE